MTKDDDRVHYCLQSDRLERMETRQDEILTTLSQIQTSISTLNTRLQYKKEKDKEQNGKITKLDEKEDDVETRLTVLETNMDTVKLYQKLILIAIIGMLITLMGFVIEFQYKTFVLHI